MSRSAVLIVLVLCLDLCVGVTHSLDTLYGQAMRAHTARNWTDSVTFFTLSLRLHRALTRTAAFCGQSCYARGARDDEAFTNGTLLRGAGHEGLNGVLRALLRASCVRACRHRLLLMTSPPRFELAEKFERREPYRYLHFAYHELNDTVNAASAVHTYLQKNPDDAVMVERMKAYSSIPGLHDSLINFEEREYERSFLSAVLLLNSGDYNGCVERMEEALADYLHEYALCTAACESAVDFIDPGEFYASLADAFTEALKCQVRCEDNLKPNVGGFFVEKFVATMYHYLQFAYYTMNDAESAVPCAASYLLLDPTNEVMKQNMRYYLAYRQQWGLSQRHFSPRAEAEKYFNQTAVQKQMLEYAENYVHLGDEDAMSSSEEGALISPDLEFGGTGGYEEGIYAKWTQVPKSKWDNGESDE